MSAKLDSLRKNFTDAKSGIDAIEGRARTAGRDLTDAEQTEVDTLLARCEDLAPEIEAEGAKADRMAAASSVLARIQPKSAPALIRSQPTELPSIGDYMSMILRSKQGDTDAELMLRTVATQITTDTPGIIPVPIVGPLLELADHNRPIFNSMTARPMPDGGKTFSRPQITQHVTVANQATELAEVASQKMTISSNTVTKLTYAGALELSEQDIDFTDPAVLNVVLADFVNIYGDVVEAKAVTALTTLAAATSTWTATNIGTIISSVTAGVLAVYTASKRMPDRLYLSLDQVLALSGNTNATTNVSAITLIEQALASAGLNINIVVAPTLPSGTRILGCSSLVEAYEKRKGLISAPDVSHLGVVIAYRGYVAFFGLAAGFVSLV